MPLTDRTAIRRRWVKALRSGEYQQGRGFLHITESSAARFCCLGVLCDLAAEAGVIPPPAPVDNEVVPDTTTVLGYGDEDMDGDDSKVPPLEVVEWVGLRSNNGAYDDGALTELNDKGWTFAQIADIIEDAPKGLFVD